MCSRDGVAIFAALLAVIIGSQASAQPLSSAPASSQPSALDSLRRDAAALRPLVEPAWVQRFLAATAELPAIAPRTVYHDAARTAFYSQAEYRLLADSQRAALTERVCDDGFYYNTRYGSPLAYARPFVVLGQHGVTDVRGRRIADFGYGTVGQLRLLALLGADVVGIEVDPLLRALYSEAGDAGEIRAADGARGRITLVQGRFPVDGDVRRAVGDGFDVFISKNTLKRGYVHPERPADPRRLIQLGVDDATFVGSVCGILKPGGLALLYNLCPAPAPPDAPFIPWADGRSPFARETWEAAGFRIIAFDCNDDAAARAMGAALGWDRGEGAMNLESDLFATYTLVEKR